MPVVIKTYMQYPWELVQLDRSSVNLATPLWLQESDIPAILT